MHVSIKSLKYDEVLTSVAFSKLSVTPQEFDFVRVDDSLPLIFPFDNCFFVLMRNSLSAFSDKVDL